MLGIGIGGTAEKAMTLAKESLMGDIDILDLLVLKGESVLRVVRPLLVRMPSLGLGVGGLCT